MIPKLITSPAVLITSHEATCAGFLAQAKAKNLKAAPYVTEALKLWELLLKSKKASATIDTVPLKTLATATGLSDKARRYFNDTELRRMIRASLASIMKTANYHFREEILYRYLLTKGDTLGGEMRNVTGALAQAKFTKALAQNLRRHGLRPICKIVKKKVVKISWKNRVLLFDRTPALVSKNVDVVLLEKPAKTCTDRELLGGSCPYIAFGELKGGIDPAGADEHWKTARSALHRIRAAFGKDCPKLFFAGSAIQAAMAKEIFQQLNNGELSHAANLIVEAQVQDLCAWLVSL